MNLQLARSILFAKDMSRLTAFYGDSLGLSVLQSEFPPDEWVEFAAGSCNFALHRIPNPWAADVEIEDPPVVRQGAPTKLVFRVEDLEAARATLKQRGVTELDPGVINAPGERVRCDFVDPEGNVFQLSTR